MQSKMQPFKKTGKVRLMAAIVLRFALLAEICFAGQSDPYLEATAGRVPDIDISYFGTHFHRLVLNSGESNLRTIWPTSNIGTIRLWDSGTLWSEIATQPGQWKYERMDEYVEQATFHNATVLYTLGGTPRWASARPNEKCSYGLGCAAEPVRMAHWEEYVRRVVQRYHGRIKAYELWNEPNFSDIARDRGQPSFYTGSIAQMVEMAKIARKVLDENDPDAVLSTPGFVNGPDRLELFLQGGGKQYTQAIAYHFYSGNSELFARQLVEVRAIMKRQGLENLPLWNTETGVEVHLSNSSIATGSKTLTYPEAAVRLAQFLILGSAAGLEHFYHYAWDDEVNGMMNRAGETLPNKFAYEKVQSWLIGSKMQGCKKMLPQAVLCKGEREGVKFVIAWSETIGTYFLPTPTGWAIHSLEHFLDASANPYATKSHDKGMRLELGPQPLFIQYKANA
jgi:hypothetical protein